MEGGSKSDPSEEAEELVALESQETKQFQADGHPLSGVSHSHHSDEVGEGEGKSKPGTGLDTAELHQAESEDKSTECVHQVNTTAPVGAYPIQEAIARLIF